MKIVHVNAVTWGSTGRNAIEMIRFCTREGHDSLLAYSDGTCPSDINGYQIGNKFDHKVHAFFSRLTGMQGYYSILSSLRFISWLKKEKPDIVHLHNLHANYINLPILMHYLAREEIITFVTLHDCWFYTGKCTHYITCGCYKWKDHCGNCPLLHKDNASWYFDKTTKLLNDKKKWFDRLNDLRIIAVSRWIRDQSKESILMNAKSIDVVYNWVNTQVFYPRSEIEICSIKEKYNIKSGEFVCLFVSAIWKNDEKWQRMIEISRLLEEDIQVVCVGSINKDLSMPPNITFIPFIDNIEEMSIIYSMADVYVHVSAHDTFGKVVVEAMACGTPAIVFNNTALPELVSKESGFVVPDNDCREMVASINIVKKRTKASYSKACTKFVMEHFDLKVNIQKHLELYQLSMSRRGSER